MVDAFKAQTLTHHEQWGPLPGVGSRILKKHPWSNRFYMLTKGGNSLSWALMLA